MALPSRYVPRSRYPTGWQASAPMELASNLYRYGSNGRPGVASVNFSVPGEAGGGSFALTPPEIGAAGPTGDEQEYPDTTGARNPNLTTSTADFMESPMIGQDPVSLDGPTQFSDEDINADGNANAIWREPKSRRESALDGNPLDSAGMPAQPTGRDTSVAGQSQRYYDRKFAKMSRNPVERYFSRRIYAGSDSVQNVSRPLNPVRFNNSTAGHSPWQPSRDTLAPAPVRYNNEVPGHKAWTAY